MAGPPKIFSGRAMLFHGTSVDSLGEYVRGISTENLAQSTEISVVLPLKFRGIFFRSAIPSASLTM